ncbi:phage virion morphogenesis protein [Maritalea porphyrae]|uniref:phage virion morphogenesis protein n=1 Tax=Maritalea porphyrae TaxID=880732 RepID=UPI0022AFDE21|nr:phage virion morphogenesis protein [Maritalea porphyrae]MCZ4273312.1 phage virion morphogenesis protein [Maritalea porphyrae]
MISFKYEFDELNDEMTALIERIEDKQAAHMIIGQTLLNRHRQRFMDEVSPDGKKWAALSPLTLELRRSPIGILRDTGELMRSIHFKATSDKAEVGTNLNHPKVMTHQYGATIKPKSGKSLVIPRSNGANRAVFIKQANIPARPYIGIGVGDEQASHDALLGYLEG